MEQAGSGAGSVQAVRISSSARPCAIAADTVGTKLPAAVIKPVIHATSIMDGGERSGTAATLKRSRPEQAPAASAAGACAASSVNTSVCTAQTLEPRAVVRLQQSVRVAVVGVSAGTGVAQSATITPSGKFRVAHSEQRVMVAPAGSRRRDELQADLDEARLSLVWLKTQHWEWYVALGGETRICGSLLDGALEHGLMLQGSRYLYTARMVVNRYERWGNSRASAGGAARCDMLIGESVYPPTPALVSWFISDEIADYRDLVAVRAAKGGSGKFKGTTGLGFVKSLAYACHFRRSCSSTRW